jgi:regulator of sigma E protease
VLDGGHLLFFLFEGVMGKPLSIKKREMAQQVGLFLLIVLMVFVFYNDIYRLVYPGQGLP